MRAFSALMLLYSSFAFASGRFELVGFGNDHYMLDTQTGQVWLNMCFGDAPDCEKWVWIKQDVEGVNLSTEKLVSQWDKYRKKKDQQKPFDPDKYLKEKQTGKKE